MKLKGLSLIELLVALAMTAVVMAGAARAYVTGLTFERQSGNTREAFELRVRLEDRLARLIEGSTLSGRGYFVSPIQQSTARIVQGSGSSDLGPGSESLGFTTLSEPPTASYLGAGLSLEDANKRFGPMGGSTEVGLSTTPAGDAGNRSGLFLREQRPPDSNLAKGGHETLLEGSLRAIRFEFYDGSNWTSNWDSRGGQKGKLPLLVRVTYLLSGEDQVRSFEIRVALTRGGA